MSTLAYRTAVDPTADTVEVSHTKARKNLWRRIIDTIVAAQMARAEAEIRRYQSVVSPDWAPTAWTRGPFDRIGERNDR